MNDVNLFAFEIFNVEIRFLFFNAFQRLVRKLRNLHEICYILLMCIPPILIVLEKCQKQTNKNHPSLYHLTNQTLTSQ